ncbi:hypothetical protein AS156_11590 [Bradyrhizobium macuxiense]|uniref:Uncharacterized protein n=1 Tax=Bradyrhizobium macuxiense TaxID=1755647 RepID=A0A109JN04_9BRAD|nr:hypothetical protein [Bradyrhizobium macuxiense]KWV51734.1 hypothetical protein AS156_11590 [Bradyrhizobium macuxiense]
MSKLGYVFATIGALAVAVPSIASADTIVVGRGGYHHNWNRGWNAHAEMRRDYGWHNGWRHHHDRDMIVKRHRDY